jgi:hypothetical protein
LKDPAGKVFGPELFEATKEGGYQFPKLGTDTPVPKLSFGWKPDILTGFLRELSNCLVSANAAMRNLHFCNLHPRYRGNRLAMAIL